MGARIREAIESFEHRVGWPVRAIAIERASVEKMGAHEPLASLIMDVRVAVEVPKKVRAKVAAGPSLQDTEESVSQSHTGHAPA